MENGKSFIQDDDFMSKTMRSGKMMDEYRNMSNTNELILVYKSN